MEGKLVDREKKGDIDSITDRLGSGPFQARAIFVIGLTYITEGMELLVISFLTTILDR